MEELGLLSIPITLGLGLIKLVPIELFVAYELKPHLAYDSLSCQGLMKPKSGCFPSLHIGFGTISYRIILSHAS